MKRILVAVKRVIDSDVRIRLKPDGSGVVTDGVKLSINPFCEIALEEALRIRDRGDAEEVVAVTIGPASCETQLRTALAFGADRALHVIEDVAPDPLCVAELLDAIVQREQPFLTILGKQAIDEDNGQTGQMLSVLADCAQATYVSKLELEGDSAKATREVDAGLETIEIDLPAIVTTDLRLNEPRFVKLPDILKAKRKPIEQLTASELGVEVVQRLKVIAHDEPPQREPGVKVDSVDELISALQAKELI